MADSLRGKLGIVVGGGPAPGINGVISSVTIEAVNQGLDVVGVRDGFKNLVTGDVSQARPLAIADVAPYYNRGGSLLGTSRTNPAKNPADLDKVIDTLRAKLGVSYLVTVGGDQRTMTLWDLTNAPPHVVSQVEGIEDVRDETEVAGL